MVMNVADALAAYKQGGNLSGGASGAAQPAGGESFGDMLKTYAGDTVKALEQGEQAAVAGAAGKANIANVVTAISNAELMLQTVVTIRDKVISAYQSITQSAI